MNFNPKKPFGNLNDDAQCGLIHLRQDDLDVFLVRLLEILGKIPFHM